MPGRRGGSEYGTIAVIAVTLLVSLAALPATAQAKAAVSGNTINIWSEGGGHVQTCDTLRTDVNNAGIVNTCTSSFAATCISVASGYMINLTRGGDGNWTNFTIDSCELRINLSGNGITNITSWGNLSILNSNVSTNASTYKSLIIIKANSNFSMQNSFARYMGYGDVTNRRGIELNSPVFTFSNNTITSCYAGISLYGGANGSTLTNLNISSSVNQDVLVLNSSNNTLAGMFSLLPSGYSGLYGINLSYSSNNTLANITAVVVATNSYGVYLISSHNNTLSNINVTSASNGYGVYLQSSLNNTIDTINTTSTSSGYGLYVYYSNYTFIKNLNSTITNTGSGTYTIYSSENTITNSNSSAATGSTGNGIALVSSWNTTVSFINASVTGTSTGNAIYLSGSNNSVINVSGIATGSSTSASLINDYSSTSTVLTNITANSTNANGITISTGTSVYNVTVTHGNFTCSGGYCLSVGSLSNSTIANNTATLIAATGTALYFTSCFNNTITNNTVYMAGSGGNGIYLTRSYNNTISFNNVTQGGTYGIYLFDASRNNTVFNNTISGGVNTGIYVRTSWLNNITNNTANTTTGNGIYMQDSCNNTVTDNNATSSSGSGIYMQYGNNTVIANNTALSNSGNGIYLSYTKNNSILDNNASVTGTAASYAIYLEKTNTTMVVRNNVSSNTGVGVYLSLVSFNNTIANMSVLSNGGNGIYLFNLCENNTITNINITSTAGGGNGIYISSSKNNTVSNVYAAMAGGRGVYIFSGSSNNTISNVTLLDANITVSTGMNNTFTNFSVWNCTSVNGCIGLFQSKNNNFFQGVVNLTTTFLVNLQDSNETLFQDIMFINVTNINGGINITSLNSNRKSRQNTFLNCSFTGATEAVGSNSQLIRQWYMYAHANYTNGTTAVGANVSVWNSTGVLESWSLTNSTGWTAQLNVTQYTNITGRLNVSNNHTIQGSMSIPIGGFLGSFGWAVGNGSTGTFTTSDGWTAGDMGNNMTLLSVTMYGVNTSCDSTACFFRYTNMINITGPTNCTGLYYTIMNTSVVNLCTSPFASACISVASSINITDKTVGGNLTLDGCELRINLTANGERFITNWGNLTVLNSNITTSSSSLFSEINVSANSNFTMRNSFITYMGWATSNGQRGLEVNTSVFSFSNNTIKSGRYGLVLHSNSNGSIISNLTSYSHLSDGLYVLIGSNNTIRDSNFSYNSNTGMNISFSLNNTFDNITATGNTGYGIFLNIINNSAISNVTSRLNGGGGMYIDGRNNTLSDINASSNTQYGIYMTPANNNTLTRINTSQNSWYGLTVWKSVNNTFTNVTANSQSSYYGVYVITFSTNNNFTNVVANSNGQYGVYTANSNSTFVNVVASTNIQHGIYLALSSNGNNFTNVSVNDNLWDGIFVENSNNNTFSDINIWNCSSKSTVYACINVSGGKNNTFIRGTVNNTQKMLVNIFDANSTLFRDIVFINVTNINGGINISSTNANRNSFENVFLNCSFLGTTEATGARSGLIRQWYLDIHVNYTNSTAASGANISVWNTTGILINYTTANSTGWGYRLNITQYANTTGGMNFSNNHTVQVNVSGFTNLSASWAVGNGTSGTFVTADGWTGGDWNSNNTRLAFTLNSESLSLWMFSPNASYYNTTLLYLLYTNTTADTVWYNYTSGNVTVAGNGTLNGIEGSNIFMLWVNDTTPIPNNVHNHTDPFTIRIDTQPPNTTLDNVSENIIPYSQRINVSGICHDDGSAGTSGVYTNNTYFAGVMMFVGGDAIYNLSNTSGVPDGTHNVYIFCNDTFGNNLNFSRLTFTLDSKTPFVWLLSPNGTYLNTTTLNLNFINTTTDTLWYNYTSGNVTIYGNTTITGVEGSNNLTLFTNNTVTWPSNQVNSSEPFTVRIDTRPPNTTVDNASGSAIGYSPNIAIQGTCADQGVSGLHYAYTNNTNFTGLDTEPEVFNLTNTSSIPDGNSTVYVFCNDSAGNNLNFSRIVFSLDSAPPTTALTGPADGHYNDTLSPARVTISCSMTDLNALSNVTFYITDSINRSFSPSNTTQKTGTSNTSSWALDLTYGNYTWNCLTFDAHGRSAWGSNRSIMINVSDFDSDGVMDINDTLEGNESSVSKSGVTSLNITVGGNATNGTFSGTQDVVFYDSGVMMLNFSHNFSGSDINLSRVSVTKTANSIVVNLSGQLQSGYNKTVYISDNGFASICVKDAEISSISEMSSDCTGAGETDLTACLGGSLTANNIICTDLGSVISIANMSHSGVRGVPASAAESAETTIPSGCLDDSNCGPLRVCVRGGCRPVECKQDSDCGPRQYCSLNKCNEKWPPQQENVTAVAVPRCSSNSQCNTGSGEVCLNGACVKLFDIKIENFGSDAKVGGMFDFGYYVKGMANISGDVDIRFWLETNGSTVTSGKDTIYVGNLEGVRRSSSLLLPRTIKSGIYEFHVQLEYGEYRAGSYRTVEIAVGEDGNVRIKEQLQWQQMAVYAALIAVIIALLAVIIRMASGRRRGRFGKSWFTKWKLIHKRRLSERLWHMKCMLKHFIRTRMR